MQAVPLWKLPLPQADMTFFMTDLGDSYNIEINTPLGEELTEGFAGLKDADADDNNKLKKSCRNKKKLILSLNFHQIKWLCPAYLRSHFIMKSGQKQQTSASPAETAQMSAQHATALTSSMKQNLISLKEKRIRVWDSCQNESFALVAGGENFREERSERLRHRFYRKFKYPVDRYGKSFCTGCGRCSRQCMAGIDLKEILNELIETGAKDERNPS